MLQDASLSAVRTMLAWIEAIVLVEAVGLLIVLIGLVVGGAVWLLAQAVRWISGAAVG